MWECPDFFFFCSKKLIMLQAFEPPLDMSQDIDVCENSHCEDVSNDHISGSKDTCSCHSAYTSEKMFLSTSNEACCGEESNVISNSPKRVTTDKVLQLFIIILAFR